MPWPRAVRAIPAVLAGAGAFAGGAYAMGSTPAQAAGAGVFIALTATAVLASFLLIRQAGRATRRGA